MKNLVSILILSLLFSIACANNNKQIPDSLSSSYDGIWHGYAQTYEGRSYNKLKIKNGIVSGSFLNQRVKGYITSDNDFIINPFYIKRPATAWWRAGGNAYIICETTYISPDRIEGTYYRDQVQAEESIRYKWYVVKPATGMSDTMNSVVQSDILISSIRLRNPGFQNINRDFLYAESHE